MQEGIVHGPAIYFVLVIVLIQGLVAWLAYLLLLRLIPAARNKEIRRGYWAVTLLAIIVVSLSRWLYAVGIPPGWLAAAFVWVIGQAVMLPLLVLCQAIYSVLTRKGKVPTAAPSDRCGITRRDFLRNSLIVVPGLALGVTARGIYAASDITVQRYNLSLPAFPAALGRLKIVQISDTHIGPFFNMEKLDEVLAMARREKPDLMVITGDLIDELTLLVPTMERLVSFQSSLPYGMYFCWGNHEYFKDITKLRQAFKNSPIVVLENNSQLIAGTENPFYLAGVDFPWASNGIGQVEKRQLYIKSALQNIPANACTVLVSHHPDFIADAFAAGVPLTLAGHTHGGQIGLLGKPLLPLQYRFMRGMYRQGNLCGYVSTGAGHWIPFRLGCPAEIAVFTLTG